MSSSLEVLHLSGFVGHSDTFASAELPNLKAIYCETLYLNELVDGCDSGSDDSEKIRRIVAMMESLSMLGPLHFGAAKCGLFILHGFGEWSTDFCLSLFSALCSAPSAVRDALAEVRSLRIMYFRTGPRFLVALSKIFLI